MGPHGGVLCLFDWSDAGEGEELGIAIRRTDIDLEIAPKNLDLEDFETYDSDESGSGDECDPCWSWYGASSWNRQTLCKCKIGS